MTSELVTAADTNHSKSLQKQINVLIGKHSKNMAQKPKSASKNGKKHFMFVRLITLNRELNNQISSWKLLMEKKFCQTEE